MVLQYALNKIQSIDDVDVIHSVANSVNSNQLRNKRWLLKHLRPYLDMYTDPKIVVAAGWYGLAAHLIDKNVVSFDANPKPKPSAHSNKWSNEFPAAKPCKTSAVNKGTFILPSK